MFNPRTVKERLVHLMTARGLKTPAFKVISRLQGSEPHEQIMGTAVALIAMCDAVDLSLNHVLTKAQRVLKDVDSPFAFEIGAIREYAKNEIKRIKL